jgi:hypothetical protein
MEPGRSARDIPRGVLLVAFVAYFLARIPSFTSHCEVEAFVGEGPGDRCTRDVHTFPGSGGSRGVPDKVAPFTHPYSAGLRPARRVTQPHHSRRKLH